MKQEIARLNRWIGSALRGLLGMLMLAAIAAVLVRGIWHVEVERWTGVPG